MRLFTALFQTWGWVELCKVDDRKYPFKQRVLTRYQAYLMRDEEGEYLRLLKVIADHQNQQKDLICKRRLPWATGQKQHKFIREASPTLVQYL